MKAAVIAVAGLIGAGAGLMACGAAPVTVLQTSPATQSSSAPPPGATKTVVKVKTVQAATPTSTSATAAPVTSTVTAAAPATSTAPAAVPVTTAAPAPQQPADQNVTDPWAVVSAYYGDIESGNYTQAYALIGDGATTGQSYQDFVAGFSCTGAQAVSENWESGDQVNFDLAATDSCSGVTRQYTGTDTVQNGIIVAANVVQTG
jgi:hypothetical protein